VRLKRDIERVGSAPNGLPLYTFRYLWSDAVYRGVMAQDVLEVFPEAVSTMPGGYLGVRYDMLGLEMTRVH
ncbi:tail fiber domain-containing protein, partial [Mesorhizobium marinum]|uniref:tail fiber domain-containing protein n=1 Tax=Mesorhizobium marinum TaxID=3228790 RepID=UPI003466F9AE